MKSRYLVTGANGMLGRALVDHLKSMGESVVATDLPEVDLTIESSTLDFFEHVQPTHVIHAAAYTDVNGAETNQEICHAANVTAPLHVARACARFGARMVHVSTDYVFDGSARMPYRETDVVNPLSEYGRSKLGGERAVADALENYQIVRTAWLFGAGKRTFVSAILGALAKGGPVKVVEDEFGSPTYAADLAKGLVALSRVDATGIFHLVNGGYCSRYQMALHIARCGGYSEDAVTPIRSDEWTSPAARPLWSVLDCSRAYSLGVAPLRSWEDAISGFLGQDSAALAQPTADTMEKHT